MYVVYPAIFYKNKDEKGYTVVFPDFNDGATCGDDLNEAVYMAEDYIGSWLYEDFLQGNDFPKPSALTDLVIEDDEFSIPEESFKSLVGLDLEDYVKKTDRKTVRKTVTIPSYLNEIGKVKNVNFSKLLTEALLEELGG